MKLFSDLDMAGQTSLVLLVIVVVVLAVLFACTHIKPSDLSKSNEHDSKR